MSEKRKNLCDELKKHNFYEGSYKIPPSTYTVHRWAHTYHPNFPEKMPKDIFELVKNAKNVSELVDKLPQL
jgi:hypothetical protein